MRLKPEQFKKRVLELETLYGQKNLSKTLGVSMDSIRRYRDGKTYPQTKKLYEQINKLYNKNKKFIDTGLVEQKRKQIEQRKKIQALSKTKERFALIYPDYMYGRPGTKEQSPASEFQEVKNFDKLEDLHDAGYVAGWRGTKKIPLEVQFVIGGENLTRWGRIVKIIGIVTKEVSPKANNDFAANDIFLEVYRTPNLLIRGLDKSLNFEERIDLIRNFFFTNLEIERGLPMAFLGFYFDEADEI